jgi:hypothetical protein
LERRFGRDRVPASESTGIRHIGTPVRHGCRWIPQPRGWARRPTTPRRGPSGTRRARRRPPGARWRRRYGIRRGRWGRSPGTGEGQPGKGGEEATRSSSSVTTIRCWSRDQESSTLTSPPTQLAVDCSVMASVPNATRNSQTPAATAAIWTVRAKRPTRATFTRSRAERAIGGGWPDDGKSIARAGSPRQARAPHPTSRGCRPLRCLRAGGSGRTRRRCRRRGRASAGRRGHGAGRGPPTPRRRGTGR